jgi:hypothetical protein
MLQLSQTETAIRHLEITVKISPEVLIHKIETALTVPAITNDQAQTTHQATATEAVAAACLAEVVECPVAEAVEADRAVAEAEDKNSEPEINSI